MVETKPGFREFQCDVAFPTPFNDQLQLLKRVIIIARDEHVVPDDDHPFL